jgi:hypothetical protein
VSSVRSRVAAFERQNPVLRSISKPTWITASRQRSTTDAVLSWLNAAGRRTGGTPTSQDTTGDDSGYTCKTVRTIQQQDLDGLLASFPHIAMFVARSLEA